jgi:hypothetical protein
MNSHDVARLARIGPDRWTLWCGCLRPIHGADPLDCHRRHQEHVVAEELAGEAGVEPLAS